MSDKKKILFIAHWYPNELDTHKGIFIRNHAKSLHAVSKLTVIDFNISGGKEIYTKKVKREIDQDGLDILHIHINSKYYKFLYYFLTFQFCVLKKALKKENIQAENFDLIMSNVLFPSGIIGYRLAKKYRKPLYHIEHWSYLSTFLKKDFHRKEGAKVLKYASKVMVVSEILKKSMEQFCDAAKIAIIPNVVDSHFHFEPKDNKKGIIEFLAIANWRKPKNPFVFIASLEELAQQRKDLAIRLVMVGEGDQLNQFKAQKHSFEIIYPGKVANADLQSYYQRSDYFLHGSDYETFSIVAIEALLTGTPVIASKVGILPEVIDYSNGILCENDSNSWLEGLKKALDMNFDNKRIAENIKDQFTLNSIAKKFEENL